MEKLNVKKLRENAVIPTRATGGSAGYDIYACIDEPVVLKARSRAVFPTGIAIAIDDANVAAFVFARSGLGINRGIAPSNCVGVIDSDYRGECMVGLTNHSDEDYTVQPGERIAQMIFMPVYTPELVWIDELPDTARGEGGFGSTGKQ